MQEEGKGFENGASEQGCDVFIGRAKEWRAGRKPNKPGAIIWL